MTLQDAMRIVGAQCAPDVHPCLSQSEVAGIVKSAQRFSIWTPNTSYVFGCIVIPAVRNGHTYKAIVNQQFTASPAGVSGPTEPIWPLYTNPDRHVSETRPYWGGYGGPLGNYAVGMVTDNTIIWQEAGPDTAEQWDIRAAVHEAWLRKAGKASARYDLELPGAKAKRSQVVDHCLTMAQRYASTGVY